jgi:hypothetical protein
MAKVDRGGAFMLESGTMTHRFFFGFFFYPSPLAEGTG